MKPFGKMTPEEVAGYSRATMIKIALITGWIVPEGKYLDILLDQFAKKMLESYPKVNPEEVEYAFRTEGTVIKDWGKQMNLSLIDEVMIPYSEKRFEISRIEEQLKIKALPPPPITEDISDEGMDKFWDATEELVAKGNYPIELIPPMLYDWMDKNGNILFNRDDKLKFLERATLVRHTAIAHAFEKNPYSLETKAALNDFNRMREIKKYSEAEHEKIKELAKKMVVFEMMKTKLAK